MLSKTRFQYAMICRKRAWLDAHRRELARPPGVGLRLRLADGHRIGRIARDLWAGGVLVTEPSARHARAAARTSLLLEDPSVGAIFEGAFAHDGLHIRADAIVRKGSHFELVEVKASSRPRDAHLLDLAIQAYVIDGSGIELASASLLHVNPDYVWDGEGGGIDPAALFVRVDRTEEIFRMLPEVRERGRDFRELLATPTPPEIAMGPQCHMHDVCPFLDTCHRDAGTAARRQSDRADMAAAIARLAPAAEKPPVALLDLQSFSTALPRVAGTSPHERIPFLWSLRIVRRDGSQEDHHDLAAFDADPRAALTDSLATRLPTEGPIAFFSSAVPRTLEALAARGIPGAKVCARALQSNGLDLHSRAESALGPPRLGESWSWETLTAAVSPAGAAGGRFASRSDAAAAYVEAIERTTPRARRDVIASELVHYGRGNLMALAGLSGVARVSPRV